MSLEDAVIEQICETTERIAELVEMAQRTALDHGEPELDRLIELERLTARMRLKLDEIDAMIEIDAPAELAA
jgi:hypothetical protein